MPASAILLKRLDEIGSSLACRESALALIGLGSAGVETSRMDEFSDLDFFVVVRAGAKGGYLENLSWLAEVHPIGYYFRNTVDGYKLLFTDGMFCEFAVFEPDELAAIPFAPGRVVWKRAEIPEAIAQPATIPAKPEHKDLEWLLGEALTNLYIGLQRERRGEKLSATRFIQGYALDRVLDLASYVEYEQAIEADAFNNERHFEQRFPGVARRLQDFSPGYAHNAAAASAILAFLETHFSVNPAMRQALRELIATTQG